jgi:FkbM family methyltransferase
LLVANSALNHLLDKITTYPIALGDKKDTLLLFEISENNSGDHRVCFGNEGTLRKTLHVRGTTLDSLITEFNPHETLIWIDTQGFEAQILAGATKVLSKKPPLVLEFWPYGMARANTYEQLKKILLDNHYSVFYEIGNTDIRTGLSVESLDQLYKKLGENEEAAADILVL